MYLNYAVVLQQLVKYNAAFWVAITTVAMGISRNGTLLNAAFWVAITTSPTALI